jgi:hypothetical protein
MTPQWIWTMREGARGRPLACPAGTKAFLQAQGFEALAPEGFGLLGFGEPASKSEADIIALGLKVCRLVTPPNRTISHVKRESCHEGPRHRHPEIRHP